MNEDSIKPAINPEEGPNLPLSRDEFQRRLYAWFEDRGLLSELRSHLRVQMIGVLKETNLGRTVSTQLKQSISPKVQAINMLIAEFLLLQDYHYSLSVFSTEVPLVNVLPEFSNYVINGTKKNIDKKWRFQDKDMWDILETLGIMRESDDALRISLMYYNETNEDSLLTCVIRLLHTLGNKSALPTKLEFNSNEPWVENVNKLLIGARMNPQSIDQISERLKMIVVEERERIKQEEREEFVKLEARLEQEVIRKEAQFKRKINEIEKSFTTEKNKLKDEHKQKYQRYSQWNESLQQQSDSLKDRLDKVIKRERVVSERENEVEQRDDELERKEKRIHAEYENLYGEKVAITGLRQKLEQEIRTKEKASEGDENFLKHLQDECENLKSQLQGATVTVSQTAVSAGGTFVSTEQQTTENNQDRKIEDTLMKGMVKQLQLENNNLRNLSTEQQLRIQELSQRASTLMHEVENSTGTVHILTGLHRNHRVLSTPPMPAPPIRHRSNLNTFNGGGEEGHHILVSPSPRQFRNYSNRENRRRAPPRRLTVHSSSSEEPSPTDEILQEARQRLRTLEIESEQADRNYRSFRLRRNDERAFPYNSISHDVGNERFSRNLARNNDDNIHVVMENEQVTALLNEASQKNINNRSSTSCDSEYSSTKLNLQAVPLLGIQRFFDQPGPSSVQEIKKANVGTNRKGENQSRSQFLQLVPPIITLENLANFNFNMAQSDSNADLKEHEKSDEDAIGNINIE